MIATPLSYKTVTLTQTLLNTCSKYYNLIAHTYSVYGKSTAIVFTNNNLDNFRARRTALRSSPQTADRIAGYLPPRQLGVGVAGRVKAAVHAERRLMLTAEEEAVLIKMT